MNEVRPCDQIIDVLPVVGMSMGCTVYRPRYLLPLQAHFEAHKVTSKKDTRDES